MACDVKLLIQSYNSDSKVIETRLLTIQKGINNTTEISFDNIVEYIVQLPKKERTKLAAQLRAAKVLSLTDADIKNHIFISNTTVETLKNKYNDLKEAYPDLIVNPEDNYTIIACNKMAINGSSYYGRTIDTNGLEIFFINGYYGTQHFLKYLDVKNKISNAFEGKKLKNEFLPFQTNLDNLSVQFNMSGEKILTEFLNNKSQFTTFFSEGRAVVPQRILNEILYNISGNYNPDNGKTDVQISLESIKEKTNNNFDWKFSADKFYDTISMYYKDIPSKVEFLSMNEDLLDEFLSYTFLNDPKLMKAKLSVLLGGENITKVIKPEVVKMAQSTIKELWEAIKNLYEDLGITLPPLTKMMKDSPELVIGILTLAFSSNSNLNVSIQDNKVLITYETPEKIIENTTTKYLTLLFPWASIGDTYNFTYDSNYLFSPVKISEDNSLELDGIYLGVYIYKYFNPKTLTAHYAISRNIISPKSYASTYPNIESAKHLIELWNKTLKINEYGLYSIKLGIGRPRTAKLDTSNISEGLLITVLDIDLPNVTLSKMPLIFRDAFNGTLDNFYKIFNKIENISTLNTPEKAAAFILKFYNLLKSSEKGIKNISTIIDTHIEDALNIIGEINLARKINYQIESLQSNYATLKYLKNNGNEVSIEGKFENGVAANTPTIAAMNLAILYFNKLFNINILSLSKSELLEFSQANNLDLENRLDSIRAFIYNGQIYINGSNANVSDLFHEMSHIFLGLLKVKYPNAYLGIINKYQTDKKFIKNYKYIDKAYLNFSKLDKVEEAVVDMIALLMFNKKSLVDSFKGEEFINDFMAILGKFPALLNEVLDSGLGFTGFMNDLMSKENMSLVRKNMLISQAVKAFIKEGKIKEIC